MTPKEKAINIISTMSVTIGNTSLLAAKHNALFMVNTILTDCTWTLEQYSRLLNTKPYDVSKECTTDYWL